MNFLRLTAIAPIASAALILGGMSPASAETSFETEVLETPVSQISEYVIDSDDQISSISTFSDVYPTDWPYQALKGLVESYGCVAGYPDGTFRGNRAISRYEAAALLNACLDNITQVTDEIRALMREFEVELSILKGRVDGLEARVGELEAMRFSTTTKFNMFAVFTVNSLDYMGSELSDVYDGLYGATTTTYSLLPIFRTSFTGKDMLEIWMQASNIGGFNNPSCGAPYAATASAYCIPGAKDNSLSIYRMFYKFPVGEDFTVTVSPTMDTFDFLTVGSAALSPKAGNWVGLKNLYTDAITMTNVPGVFPYVVGAGAAVGYSKNGWSLDAGFTSHTGEQSDAQYGLFGEDAANKYAVQLSYSSNNAGFQAAWTNTTFNPNQMAGSHYYNIGTPLTNNPFTTNSFDGTEMVLNTAGLAGYWYITDDFSLSGGVYLGFYEAAHDTAYANSGDQAESSAWTTTLQWERFLSDETTISLSFGQPNSLYSNDSNVGTDPERPWFAAGSLTWQVNNNMTVTPIIYWMKGMGGKNDPDGAALGATLMTSVYF
jgi:hypothetical protein